MLKSYNFWIRLVAVIVLLLRVIGAEFGFSIDAGLIIDIATAVASVLVVLGIIQVPADTGKSQIDTEINLEGGEKMNSYEQIKNDITLAKDKLLKSYENSEILQEVVKLLDKILVTSMDATLDVTPIEHNTIVIGEDEPVATEEIREEVLALEETEIVEPEIADCQPIAEPEDIEEVLADSAPIIPNEIPTGATTEAKIKEVLRAKLMEILDRDLDDIISQIS